LDYTIKNKQIIYRFQWLRWTHACIKSFWLTMDTCWPATSKIRFSRIYSVISSIVEWDSFTVSIFILFDEWAWSDFVVLEEFGAGISHWFLIKWINYILTWEKRGSLFLWKHLMGWNSVRFAYLLILFIKNDILAELDVKLYWINKFIKIIIDFN